MIKNYLPILAVFFLSLSIFACGGSSSAPEGDDVVVPPADNNLSFSPPPIMTPIASNFDIDSIAPGHPFFNSPHSNPIVINNGYVYVVNTPSDTLDVISIEASRVVKQIPVGIDPVGLSVRPDGKEIWVSNHISDSISIIDSDDSSLTFHQVIATIQEFDAASRSTRFDEPVGIAFASNDKAYVALSSLDQIAVVDVVTRQISKKIIINAQDPRAIFVRNNRLYVVAFESNNQTELSGCFGTIDGDQCTFSLSEHVVNNNNVLSLNYDADIVVDPNVPDRDLFVFETENESVVDVVSGVGTLLYGITVDSQGRVYVSQTDARNHANGRAGSQKQTLLDMGNRAFLNQIGVVDCSGENCLQPDTFELEKLPPLNPDKDKALATPFAIQISADDKTIVASAASSNKVFTLDAASGEILGQVEVGAVPRGIALVANGEDELEGAWVYNAVDNSVSHVNLTQLSSPSITETISLDDPTSEDLKLGRSIFNSALASSSGTFSCESCHPDGHTDQLLWVLGGPKCEISGCNQIPVRTTMPVRGLRDTAPYHWDGVPGDPFGGINGQFPNTNLEPNCTTAESCVLDLVDGGMASTMCNQQSCPTNDEGKSGLIDAAERDALARFMLTIPYPPARERPFDDLLTSQARTGFDDFFIKDSPNSVAGQTCGSLGCHDMPFWTSTNIPGSGMEAPTFRGLPDRWLVLPQGRVNMIELYGRNGSKGFDERDMWLRIISGSSAPQWQMFLEGSTGYSGAFARQLTLNRQFSAQSRIVREDLFAALENAALQNAIVLQGHGVLIDTDNQQSQPISLRYSHSRYWDLNSENSYSRSQLTELASDGKLLLTLTGYSGSNIGYQQPQPAIWSTQEKSSIRKIDFPTVSQDQTFRLKGRHIAAGAKLFVDGRLVNGSIACQSGNLPNCDNEIILIELEQVSVSPGFHFLQVQAQNGLFSNEFLINFSS